MTLYESRAARTRRNLHVRVWASGIAVYVATLAVVAATAAGASRLSIAFALVVTALVGAVAWLGVLQRRRA